MLATGLVLMLPTLSEIVARRQLVKGMHLWTAVVWVGLILLIVVLGDRRALRGDWREIESFDRGRPPLAGRRAAGRRASSTRARR